MSPGKRRARGRGPRGDAEAGRASGGGRAGRLRWGRGAEGAWRKGEGLLALPRRGALPVLVAWPAAPLQSAVSSSLPPACCPPMKIKTKTSRRGAVFASEAASAAQGESPLSKVSGLGREPWGGQHGLGLRASSAERRQRPVIFAEDRRACPAPSGCGARTARCWARANPYHPGASSRVGRHTVE